MAKQTTVTVTDDLDGSANAKEVNFSLNGESWTIDLSAKNRTALEKALKPFIAKATKQGRPRQASTSSKSARRPSRTDLAVVREWAKSNGHRVSERGRVSATVQQAYDAVHELGRWESQVSLSGLQWWRWPSSYSPTRAA